MNSLLLRKVYSLAKHCRGRLQGTTTFSQTTPIKHSVGRMHGVVFVPSCLFARYVASSSRVRHAIFFAMGYLHMRLYHQEYAIHHRHTNGPIPRLFSPNGPPIAIPLQTRRTREGPDSKIDRSSLSLSVPPFPFDSFLPSPDKTSHKSGVMRHQRRPSQKVERVKETQRMKMCFTFKPDLLRFGQIERLEDPKSRVDAQLIGSPASSPFSPPPKYHHPPRRLSD